jgi:hypothetical protein
VTITAPVPGGVISVAWGQQVIDTINSLAIKAVKSADQTVNNSATLVNDTELFAAVAASAVYRFELGIRYSTNTTADLKTGWVVPSGALMTFDILGTAAGAGAVGMFAWDSGSSFAFEGSGSTVAFRETGIIKTSTTPGTAQFQWSQNTANASNSKVLANSYLLLTQIG